MKLQPNIGAFIGVVRGDEIALRRREKDERASITDKDYTGQYELPGGAADPVGDKKTDYYYVFREALRELEEETGIIIRFGGDDVEVNPHALPLFFNAPAGPDLAIVYALQVDGRFIDTATAHQFGKIDFFDLDELQELARSERLVSGYGKRQHLMALHSLSVAAQTGDIRRLAQFTIEEIAGVARSADT